MTIMRIEVDGKTYQVLHYKFAINNPSATLIKEKDTYYADIGGLRYVLGFTEHGESIQSIARKIDRKIRSQEGT